MSNTVASPPRGTSTARVISLGSINADFQMRVERRPQVSETLIGRDFIRLGGGKAANVALLCDRLGLPVLLFGHVGDDDLAQQALSPLRAAGLDLSGVRQVRSRATGMAMIAVPPNGQKGIVLAPNANQEPWSARDHEGLAQALRDSPPGSVLVADAEIDRSALRRALREAHDAALRVVLDPSPADRVDDVLLAATDVVVPNAGEAQALTGIECRDPPSAARAARRLRERGVRIACVKLAEGGCVTDDGSTVLHVGALPVEVTDTTGAGDAFAGALAAALAQGRDLETQVRWAVAASQQAVRGYGSRSSYPDLEELEALAQELPIRRDASLQSG